MSLDLRTISVFAAILTLAQLLVPLFFIRIAPPHPRMRYWVAATLCSVVGFLLVSARGVFPDFVSIVVANTLHLMTGCFLYSSCRLFVDRPLPRRRLYAVPVITAVVMFYFTFVDNNMTIRALYYSFTLGCCLIHCALELRHAPTVTLRFSYWFTASVLAIYGFFLLGVRIPLLLQNPLVDMYAPTPAQFVVMIAGVLGGILWTMGFAFMVTQQLVLELNRTATHDFLTETLNRRAAQSHLATAVEKGADANAPLSVLLLDIDHFKQVNDRYGHETGDRVLVEIARLLRQHVRANDMVARWGGEEFLILLQDTNSTTALMVAERLKRVVASTPLTMGSTTVHCNVSIGIATALPPYPHSTALIGAADDALYHAKRTGRNRVAVYSETIYPDVLPAEESKPLLELFPTR